MEGINAEIVGAPCGGLCDFFLCLVPATQTQQRVAPENVAVDGVDLHNIILEGHGRGRADTVDNACFSRPVKAILCKASECFQSTGEACFFSVCRCQAKVKILMGNSFCYSQFLRFPYNFPYSLSDTGSHHSVLQFSPGTSTAKC